MTLHQEWTRFRRSLRDREARVADGREPVTDEERVAAARARVAADRKRGVETEAWILRLAEQGPRRDRPA
ncbi:hypothetical protein [Aquipuribacter nitratireducens]|uniref:Uncharacterized protein n=1 Tax=Aquipuribacter nitratireducens TaxID=650104 RepID=A0ABW0GJ14_9MICO